LGPAPHTGTSGPSLAAALRLPGLAAVKLPGAGVGVGVGVGPRVGGATPGPAASMLGRPSARVTRTQNLETALTLLLQGRYPARRQRVTGRLVAVVHVLECICELLADMGDSYHTPARRKSLAGTDSAFGACDAGILAEASKRTTAPGFWSSGVPEAQFWRVYVQAVLNLCGGDPDRAAPVVFARAVGPAALRLSSALKAAAEGDTGSSIGPLPAPGDALWTKVAIAHLSAMGGMPERSTLGDYGPLSDVDLYAVEEDTIEAAARTTDLPIAQLMHCRVFAGPVELLDDDARATLQAALAPLEPEVAAIMLAAVQTAGRGAPGGTVATAGRPLLVQRLVRAMEALCAIAQPEDLLDESG